VEILSKDRDDWIGFGSDHGFRFLLHHAQEPLRPFVLRVVQHVLRFSLFNDLPIVDENDAIRHVSRKTDFVRDDDHSHSGIRQLPDDAQDLSHQLWIKRRSRLIEQHQTRRDHQRSRNRDALLLTARQMMRQVIGMCGQADAGKQMPSQLVSFTAIHAIDVNRRLDDILDGGEMLE